MFNRKIIKNDMKRLYKKKPVVIEAIQWTGDNLEEVKDFLEITHENYKPLQPKNSLFIKTLEGKMEASIGDFIIKGVQGEFYPCKPDIFEQTYELLD